ncbi:putative flippase GtrA [Martelella mediterranea]|uniref:Putative flippase GtrA n=2 Tax=Martelella mediterranea TaxID=293089 RepID=A0A4R3NFB5_9HYPH|nr:putative flippase GtrA [Martelella mediterranea]
MGQGLRAQNGNGKTMRDTSDTVKKFVLFGGGSALGAVIDYVLTLVFHDVLGLAPWLGLALSMCVSSTVVFVYHEHITFKTHGSHWQSRYGKFIALTLIILGLRILALDLLLACGLSVYLAVAIALALISILNFAASSTFVFIRNHIN